MSIKSLGRLAALVLMCTFAACGELPEDVSKQAKAAQAEIAATNGRVNSAEQDYRSLLKQSDYKFLADATPEQRHEGMFRDAANFVTSAKEVNSAELEPLLSKNKSADKELVLGLVRNIKDDLKQARKAADGPSARAKAIVEFKPRATQLRRHDEAEQQRVKADAEHLVDTGKSFDTKYPHQADTIGKLTGSTTAKAAAITAAFKAGEDGVVEQYDNHQKIVSAVKAYDEEAGRARKSLSSLDDTVVRRLVDMRVDCQIIVVRSSWDEDSDYGGDTDYTYSPRPANTEACAYWGGFLEESDEGEFAQVDHGSFIGQRGNDFRLDNNIEKKYVDALKLDPFEKWPDNSDDSANYYIDDIKAKYFQRVREIRNGNTSEKWVPVSADTFGAHAQDIGMDIYSKPVGEFEAQASDAATPPGLAFVGNSEYGQWKEDNSGSGDSFWEFYGRYAFLNALLGNNHYSRSQWDDWDRNYRGRHQPYYGKCGPQGNKPCYGSGSTYATARYGGSKWVKSGGIKADVRNLGARVRGGGPGGGGK